MRDFRVKILVILLCLSGCKPSTPPDVLSKRQMEEILYDYHLAMGLAEAEEGNAAENRYVRVRQVFEKHGITEAQFDSSMVYWFEHAELLKEVMQRVSDRLDRKAEMLGVNSEQAAHDAYETLRSDGDTANVWKSGTFQVLLATTRQNVYTFVMTADSTFRRGDTFRWVFTPMSLSRDMSTEFYAQLSVMYENDSVAAIGRSVNRDNTVVMEIGEHQVHKEWNVKQVSGCVYMKPTKKGDFAMTALTHMALVRYHHQTAETEEMHDTILVEKTDSVVRDTMVRVRRAPHDVRGSQAKEHTIDIVKEKGGRWVKRGSRK